MIAAITPPVMHYQIATFRILSMPAHWYSLSNCCKKFSSAIQYKVTRDYSKVTCEECLKKIK